MPTQTAKKVYIVQKMTWEYNDGHHSCHGDEGPFKAFTSKEKAKAFWETKERRARRDCWNPCAYAGWLEAVTTLPEEQVIAALEELGGVGPRLEMSEQGSYRRWWESDWWKECLRRVTGEHRDRLWDVFDKLRFFQLIEVEVDPQQETGLMTLFLVRWLNAQWSYYDPRVGTCLRSPHRLVKAFTTSQQARRHCEDLNRGRVLPPRQANPFLCFFNWQNDKYRIDKGLTEVAILGRVTSFPEQIFCDWVLDTGLSPPKRKLFAGLDQYDKRDPLTFRDWYGWWEENAPKMDDYQRRKVWQALDRLKFFEVVETKLET